MKLEIPTYKQKNPYTCLPACIRSVLGYLGVACTEKEVVEACGTTKFGTSPDRAVGGVRAFGCEALCFEEGSLDFLIERLCQGLPTLVFLKVSELPYGSAPIHAGVVCGFEEEKVIYLDTGLGREVSLEMNVFLRAWQSLNSTGMVLWKRAR